MLINQAINMHSLVDPRILHTPRVDRPGLTFMVPLAAEMQNFYRLYKKMNFMTCKQTKAAGAESPELHKFYCLQGRPSPSSKHKAKAFLCRTRKFSGSEDRRCIAITQVSEIFDTFLTSCLSTCSKHA
jgi:hypothetical protein